ncbi:hypothetical protein D5R40_10975 [Okeania hirsuta]|uniref:Uncharacterized protein n=1 Tax=Okeania hirsuta TaxID=1458930 RepID=A0A3N6NZM7_9CYAN|nr:hypothetical protein D4Z78_05455 [Okeania hirsuta]RQH45195.1 hypothetical protein D5R40_10975 [Okeania hirsuta]
MLRKQESAISFITFQGEKSNFIKASEYEIGTILTPISSKFPVPPVSCLLSPTKSKNTFFSKP